MTIKYALIVAFVLTALACGQEPVASPTQDVRTPMPAPLPTSHPVVQRPTPIALHDLKVVELGSDFWPTDLSGDRLVGIGRDGEVYLANVRTGKMRQLTDDGHPKSQPVISGDIVAWTDQRREIETHDNNSRTARGFADDIFVLDLNSRETRRITEVPARRSGLKISGNRLVWQDNRNEFDEHYTHQDIYAYDLEADEEIAVAVAPGAQHWVGIEGDRVVWADNRNSAILGNGPIRLLRVSGQSLRHLPVRLQDRARTRAGRVGCQQYYAGHLRQPGRLAGLRRRGQHRHPALRHRHRRSAHARLTEPQRSRPAPGVWRLRGVDCGMAVRRV